MRKLPKIYKGKSHDNNQKVSYGCKNEKKNPRELINEMFKEGKLYKFDIEYKINNTKYKNKIIGRTNEHIITIDNQVIRINDIEEIKKI